MPRYAGAAGSDKIDLRPRCSSMGREMPGNAPLWCAAVCCRGMRWNCACVRAGAKGVIEAGPPDAVPPGRASLCRCGRGGLFEIALRGGALPTAVRLEAAMPASRLALGALSPPVPADGTEDAAFPISPASLVREIDFWGIILLWGSALEVGRGHRPRAIKRQRQRRRNTE